jgi:hypothetical protein
MNNEEVEGMFQVVRGRVLLRSGFSLVVYRPRVSTPSQVIRERDAKSGKIFLLMSGPKKSPYSTG